MNRAQSSAVGVALLLGVTAVSMAALTAGVGGVIDARTDRAALDLAASDLEDALVPAGRVAPGTERVSLDGRLTVTDRTVTVWENGDRVTTVESNALVYRGHDGVVRYTAGAIVGSGAGWTTPYREPRLVSGSDGDRPFVLSVPAIAGAVDAADVGRLGVESTHERRQIGPGTVTVAVETRTPGIWRNYFRDRAPSVETTRSDDGLVTVRARFPGVEDGYLLVHRLEVRADE